MKNRLLLVMLISALLLSPSFAFADTPDDAAANEAVQEQAVSPETSGTAVDEKASAEEADNASHILSPSEVEPVEFDPNADPSCYSWNSGRTRFLYNGTTPVKGLFKGKMKGTTTNALYYADDEGYVKNSEGIVTLSSDRLRFKVTTDGGGHKGFNPITKGDPDYNKPCTYLLVDTGHNEDYPVIETPGLCNCSTGTYLLNDNCLVVTTKGLASYNGDTYFIQDDYSVKTTSGVVTNTDGNKYFVQDGGKVKTTAGCVVDGGTTYFVQNGGIIQTAEGLVQHSDGRIFYVQPNTGGVVKTTEGWIDFGGKKYYATPGGAILTTPGVNIIGGKKYLIQDDWSVCFKKGIAAAGGNLYYVKDSSGTLYAKKEVKSGKKRYHVQSNCIVAVGPHKWKKKLYFSTTAGYLQKKTAILAWGGHYYHVNNKGLVTKNKQIKFKKKWYIANKSGTLKTGFFKWKKGLYYANAKGAIRTKQGKYVINGYTYYIGSKGRISVNQQFKGKDGTYKSDENGRLVSGIYTWKNKYYYADADYRLHKTEEILHINKKYYYNKKGGGLAKNKFFDYKGNHYYAGSDAAILTSAFSYKGYVLHPTSTGIISDDEYYKVFPDKKPKTDDGTTDSTNTNA